MSINLTRFYFDFDEDCRTGCFSDLAFQDIETIEADEMEEDLKAQNINYIRVDL